MSRGRAANKSALTSPVKPQLERQARRLARQSKQLDRELVAEMTQQTQLTGAKGRALKYGDIKRISPMTDTQRDFFESYEDGGEAFVLFGSAGTGKSFVALYHALLDVMEPDSQYDKIVLIRSSVQSRDQGHLPGDADEKMAQFELPYHAIFEDIFGKPGAYEKMKDSGKLEFMSTSFLRGSTLNNSIIIFDEVQNEDFQGISSVVTRTGKNSKLIICGDGAQNDLRHSKHDQSGFRDFIAVTKNMVEFHNFRFTTDDIVRSGICKSWLIQCERLGL